MSVINTSTNPKFLWPGQYAAWGNFYNQHADEFSRYFEVKPSDKAFEEFTGVTGFGLMPIKTQGAALIMDTEAQGFTQRFTNVTYALGYQITKEEIQDNLYEQVSGQRMPSLARSMKQTIETVDANHLNRAFDAGFTTSDGVSFINDAHLNVNGGTFSNRLTTASDLSEAAIEDLCIQIDQIQDDRGLQALIRPKKLVIHPNDRFTATRILHSDLQNDTDNNAINVLKDQSTITDGFMVSHFVTDTDAWFITTDCPFGLCHLTRQEPDVEQDNDFLTKNLLVSGDCRFSSGLIDPRGLFGSEGKP